MLSETQYFYILIAFSLSLLVNYLVLQVTHKKRIFLDEHDKVQKVHDMPTPRIGGLGIFVSCMFMQNDVSIGGYLILCAIPAFIAGFLEDYSGKVSPSQRLAIMCLSPIMLFIMLPNSIWVNWQFSEVAVVWGIMASVIYIVTLINGVNFTDGQNGLAAGSSWISFAALSALAYLNDDISLFYIGLVISVSIIGFLWYNFPFGKLFLGDGGAYLLGFLQASISLLLLHRHPDQISPLLVLALSIYPLWEVIFSVFRKLLVERISPLKSDNLHLHQILFRNKANGKGHIPSLYILPVQILFSFFMVRYAGSSAMLAVLIAGFVLLYSLVYTFERSAYYKKRIKNKSSFVF